MLNTYYKIELSNGKSFNAVSFDSLLDRNMENVNHLSFEIPMIGTNYEKIKNLVSEPINSVKVTLYKESSPSEYISTPTVMSELLFEDFGDAPSIEPMVTGNFKIKLFKITESSKAQKQQMQMLLESGEVICSLYEQMLV